MNILVIADPFLPIPPVRYGGAERMVGLLCRGLRDRGHYVRLIAAAGSSAPAELVVHPEQSLKHRWYSWQRVADLGSFAVTLGRALKDIDIVHSHKALQHWWPLQALIKQPLVITFHTAISRPHIELLLRIRKRKLRLCAVSLAHRREAPAGPWTTVYNATDTGVFPYRATPQRPPYLLYLGKLSPIKGTHIAIEVAQRCNLDLIIAGNISAEQGGREYFEKQVAPKLNDHIRWVGEVTDVEKAALCGGALALLFPSRPEPFGIVMIESMSTGTPVIALDCGAVSEVVEHGKTGYVAASVEEMVAAVGKIDQIDRQVCARIVRQKFSAAVMVDQYLQVYRDLMPTREA